MIEEEFQRPMFDMEQHGADYDGVSIVNPFA
jgi:hypothetical protein